MKIASWNVNSIRSRVDHCLKFLQEYDIDVLCLQELKCQDSDFPILDFQLAGYNCYIYGQKAYNGVAIISKIDATEIEYGFKDNAFEEQKRIIKAVINGIHLYNIYAPNGSSPTSDKFLYKEGWFKRLKRTINFEAGIEENPVIICGDYNIAPQEIDVHSPSLMRGKICFTDIERQWFSDLLNCGLTDCFRLFNKNKEQFSWWDYRQGSFKSNKGMRIDHFLTNNIANNMIKDCEINRVPRSWEKPSDHTPVILHIGE